MCKFCFTYDLLELDAVDKVTIVFICFCRFANFAIKFDKFSGNKILPNVYRKMFFNL